MKLAVLDAETSRLRDRERPQTKFWGLAIDDEDYRDFKTTDELMRFLAQRSGEKLCMYHHHDFDSIQAIMDGSKLRVDRVRKGRILRAIDPQGNEWRNSHALFPSALKEILEACGYEKPSLDDLRARNRADTVDALEAFKKVAAGFELAFGINPLGAKWLTVAGVAFAAAQKVAGELPVYLENRDCYRGGRVEAFKVCSCPGVSSIEDGRIAARYCRCRPVRSYDIASSYPFAFLDAPRTDVLYLADVDVDPHEEGACPFYLHGERKLTFPRGRFRTSFWKSSYERYIEPHAVVRRVRPVEKIRCDLGWIAALRDFVKQAYDLRARVKKTNGPLAYACKIGLNGCYGRLGMDTVREVAIQSPTVGAGDDVTYRRLPSGEFLSFVDVRTTPKANYLFASAITCNARARLYDALRKNPRAVYCDTDSVFVDARDEFQGELGNELGQWKEEGEGKLTIRGLKDYVFDGKEKLKGGREHFEWSIKKALSRGEVREVKRRRVSVYDKREVLSTGRTIPLTRYDW